MNISKGDIGSFKFIGAFYYPGFLLYRYNESVFIVDQHAGDERCRFEILKEKHSNNQKLSDIQSFACKGKYIIEL